MQQSSVYISYLNPFGIVILIKKLFLTLESNPSTHNIKFENEDKKTVASAKLATVL